MQRLKANADVAQAYVHAYKFEPVNQDHTHSYAMNARFREKKKKPCAKMHFSFKLWKKLFEIPGPRRIGKLTWSDACGIQPSYKRRPHRVFASDHGVFSRLVRFFNPPCAAYAAFERRSHEGPQTFSAVATRCVEQPLVAAVFLNFC